MLSRVANSLYWMSRYIERIENTTRLLEVNLQLFGDFEAYVDGGQEAFWSAAVASTGEEENFEKNYDTYGPENVTAFLTFDADNSSSILSCVNTVRENARMIRDQISHEMWEAINDTYYFVKSQSEAANHESLPYAFLTEMKKFTHQFFGLIDATFFHQDGFRFMQVGKFIERADQTSRMVDVKYFLPLPEGQGIGGAVDVAGWVAVLRSCSAMDAFQTEHVGEIDQAKIAEFLLLSKTFPRSVMFCLNSLDYHLRALTSTSEGKFSNRVEKELGRIRSNLSYDGIDDIVRAGLHEYIDRIQQELILIHNALYENYFEIPVVDWDKEIAYQKSIHSQQQ